MMNGSVGWPKRLDSSMLCAIGTIYERMSFVDFEFLKPYIFERDTYGVIGSVHDEHWLLDLRHLVRAGKS